MVFGDDSTQGRDSPFSRFGAFLDGKDASKAGKLKFVEHNSKKVGYVSKIKAVATEDIKEGDVIYTYSLKDSTLNVEAALKDEQVGKIFTELRVNPDSRRMPPNPGQLRLYDDQIIKLYLIHLKNSPSNDMSPYLRVLPEDFDTPMFWSPSELDELKGSPLYKSTQRNIEDLTNEYSEIFPALTFLHPEIFGADIFSKDEYLWASAVYLSRNWYKSEKIFSPLLPLIEAFNYREESSVVLQENENNELQLIAVEALESGEEIFINDGKLGNRDLLDFYGFVLEKNSNDTLPVGVGLDKEDKLFGNKKKLLERKNLKDGQTYEISLNEIPKNLIFALRVFHTTIFDYEDVSNAFQDRAVSAQNEMKVAETLVNLCKSSMSMYKTSSKEDKSILKEANLSPRKKNAVILRRSEKKILYKTLTKAKHALKQVQQSWDMRTMDIPGENLKATPISRGGGERELL